MRFLLFFILLGLVAIADAEIYKWVDDSGRVHYTDQPTSNSEKIKLSPTTIYSPAEISAGTRATNKSVRSSNNYTSFVILAPTNRETLPVNSGNLLVQFQSTPELQPGHYIQVVLDGRVLDRHYTSLDITLEVLERGSHMLHASIYNQAGGLVKRSNIVQFFARRETLLDDKESQEPPSITGDDSQFDVKDSDTDNFKIPNASGDKFQAPSSPGDKFRAPD